MKHLSHLPNVRGFEFIGVTKDGKKIDCIVALNPVGCHGVYDTDGNPCWFQLSGWLDKRATQEVGERQ